MRRRATTGNLQAGTSRCIGERRQHQQLQRQRALAASFAVLRSHSRHEASKIPSKEDILIPRDSRKQTQRHQPRARGWKGHPPTKSKGVEGASIIKSLTRSRRATPTVRLVRVVTRDSCRESCRAAARASLPHTNFGRQHGPLLLRHASHPNLKKDWARFW
jgi:hypothetical protein